MDLGWRVGSLGSKSEAEVVESSFCLMFDCSGVTSFSFELDIEASNTALCRRGKTAKSGPPSVYLRALKISKLVLNKEMGPLELIAFSWSAFYCLGSSQSLSPSQDLVEKQRYVSQRTKANRLIRQNPEIHIQLLLVFPTICQLIILNNKGSFSYTKKKTKEIYYYIS